MFNWRIVTIQRNKYQDCEEISTQVRIRDNYSVCSLWMESIYPKTPFLLYADKTEIGELQYVIRGGTCKEMIHKQGSER